MATLLLSRCTTHLIGIYAIFLFSTVQKSRYYLERNHSAASLCISLITVKDVSLFSGKHNAKFKSRSSPVSIIFFFFFKTCWKLFCYHIQHESWSTCDTVATVSVKSMHVWLVLMQRLICICIYTNMSVEMQGCKTKTCCSAYAGWVQTPAHSHTMFFEISLLLTYFVAALSFHFLNNNKNGVSCWKLNWIFTAKFYLHLPYYLTTPSEVNRKVVYSWMLVDCVL